jgi:hypothetical protein
MSVVFITSLAGLLVNWLEKSLSRGFGIGSLSIIFFKNNLSAPAETKFIPLPQGDELGFDRLVEP